MTDIEKVGDKTRQSVKWSFSLRIVQKISFFISSIILARILSPSDFGLSTMAITLDTITWLVLSLGVNSAVIHYQDNSKERLNAAFWVLLLSAFFFAGIEYSIAPIAAHFYKAPMLEPIIRVTAFGIIINSLGAVQKTILAKKLDFKRISILETSLYTMTSVLFVVFALCGFGVWSFIYPKIIYAVISTTCLWNMTKWRPSFIFDFKYWGEMLGYGKNVVLSNIIDYLLNNSSYILIGSMVGPASLGIYSFAYDKSMSVVNSIAQPLCVIAFPSFSSLQKHKEKLKESFVNTVRILSLIAFPYSIVFMIAGKEFIHVVFGAKWESSVILFQIILMFSMVRTLVQLGVPLLQAVGKPDVVLKWNLIYAPVYIFAIYTGYKMGALPGIALATTICGICGSVIFSKIITKNLEWDFSEIFKSARPAVFSSVLTGFILFFVKEIFISSGMPEAGIFVGTVLSGFAIYIFLIKLLYMETFTFVKSSIAGFVKNTPNDENEVAGNA